MRCPSCDLVQFDAPRCKQCGAAIPASRPGRSLQPVNLYDQQAANRRKTGVVIVSFLALVLLVGLGFDRFVAVGAPSFGPFGPGPSRRAAFPFATVIALGVGALSAWLGYRHGDRLVLASCRAVLLAPTDLTARQLDNVVEEMAIASGLPKPKVYVVQDSDPNAFATGRDPAHASIAVTRGLLRIMNREELQGVIAHEMSHIRNYDTRVMTVTASLLGAVLLLHDWSARTGPWRERDPHEGRGAGGGQLLGFIVWGVLVLLAPLLGQLLAMSVSRSREYLADASGAELTRNPLGLASALRKLEAAAAPTHSVSLGTAPLCICDPLGHAVDNRQGFWADLLATHPPMSERIRLLEAMAYTSHAGPLPLGGRGG
jgi:heat shock protein HtpX